MATDSPSLWQLVTAPFRASLERRFLEAEVFRGERIAAGMMNRTIEMMARQVEPDADEAYWTQVGQAGKRGLDDQGYTTLREQAQKAALQSPHLSGYLNTLERFVMGKGATITVVHDKEDVVTACDAHWDKFCAANNWNELEDEIPLRLWRDGEVFIRRFDNPAQPLPTADVVTALRQAGIAAPIFAPAEAWPKGVPVIRLVPPEQICDPTQGKISGGIVTAADDAQMVLGYCWCPDPKKLQAFISATDMIHQKVRADSDVKRGRSLLEPLLERNKQYEDWLKYRIILNFVRSAVVLVKTVEKATPGQLQAIRDTQASQRDDSSNDRRTRAFKPGTTITAPAGTSIDFKSANLNAQDARYDGRNILLSMAAATGMAEFIFTGDASNANYASTMVTESPTLRECEYRQDQLEPTFVRVKRWNLVHGARMRQIPGLTEEEAKIIPIAVSFPPLQSRDELKQTQRNKILVDTDVLSREGMAEDEGIDYKVEQDRIEKERKAREARMPKVPPVDPNALPANPDNVPDPALQPAGAAA